MCRPPRGHPLTKIAPYKESSRCCSHIQRRGGRPSRRKPGSKSSRWPGDRSDPFRGASNLTGRSNVRTTEAAKYVPRVKRIAGVLGVPSCSDLGEGQCRHSCSGTYLCRTPRGRRGWHVRTECAVKARYAACGIAGFMPSAELRRTGLECVDFRALFARQRAKIAPIHSA